MATPTLLISGTVGSGKTTVAGEISEIKFRMQPGGALDWHLARSGPAMDQPGVSGAMTACHAVSAPETSHALFDKTPRPPALVQLRLQQQLEASTGHTVVIGSPPLGSTPPA